MMQLAIMPYESAGPIRFGMAREAVRKTVGLPYSTFRKSPESKTTSDAFDDEGIYIYYRESETVEAVEMALPARPTLEGVELLGRPYRDVSAFIKSLDSGTQEDDAGLTSFALGIGLYAPSAAKEPVEPVESVIAFDKDYYS
jgi:hypothetical protein